MEKTRPINNGIAPYQSSVFQESLFVMFCLLRTFEKMNIYRIVPLDIVAYCWLRLHSTWLPSSKLETTSRELCFFLNLKPQKNSWELHIILLLCSFLAVNSHWFVMKYYYNLFNNGSVNLFKDIRKCSTTEKCQGLAIYKKNSQICCIEKFCALKLQS